MENRLTAERAELTDKLLDFLNAWECRASREKAAPLFRDWILAHATELDGLQATRIGEPGFPERLDEVVELYADLLTLRRPELIHNWSDACASKMLNQLAPGAFVMWDNQIKVYAAGDYRTFLQEMHQLALRLIDESPADDARALEEWLQAHLGYPIRKTIAKYLDEYNWHVAVGRGYAPR